MGEFWLNGEYIFDAMMFAGNVGVYAGSRPGAFSVSINSRLEGVKTELDMLTNIASIFAGNEDIG